MCQSAAIINKPQVLSEIWNVGCLTKVKVMVYDPRSIACKFVGYLYESRSVIIHGGNVVLKNFYGMCLHFRVKFIPYGVKLYTVAGVKTTHKNEGPQKGPIRCF